MASLRNGNRPYFSVATLITGVLSEQFLLLCNWLNIADNEA